MPSILSTPLEIGTVLATSPGDLPCKEVFHIIFKENISTPWAQFRLRNAFLECLQRAQITVAHSVVFSLFISHRMLTDCRALVHLLVDTICTNEGIVDDISLVSHRSDIIDFASKVLHSKTGKKSCFGLY